MLSGLSQQIFYAVESNPQIVKDILAKREMKASYQVEPTYSFSLVGANGRNSDPSVEM